MADIIVNLERKKSLNSFTLGNSSNGEFPAHVVSEFKFEPDDVIQVNNVDLYHKELVVYRYVMESDEEYFIRIESEYGSLYDELKSIIG